MRNLHAMFLSVLVYALVGFFNFASAQTLSVFLGPYEVSQYGYFQSIDELYHRYTHPYIGVIFLF